MPQRARDAKQSARTLTVGLTRASVCAVALGAVALIASTSAQAAGSTHQLLWPAYKYPNLADPANEWAHAIASGSGQVFVVNPANGPGKVIDPAYQKAISAARSRGIELIGYIWTDYGDRQKSAVKADVDRWRSLYGITSIFLDEAASKVGVTSADTRRLDHYGVLSEYIRTRGGTVTLNPGTVPDAAYLQLADCIVVFEGSAASYATTTFPSWTVAAPDTKIAHVVYDASAIDEKAIVTRAAGLGAGRIFVTNDTLANPYDSLPAYYDAERAQIAALG
jgi:hypothetical protein